MNRMIENMDSPKPGGSNPPWIQFAGGFHGRTAEEFAERGPLCAGGPESVSFFQLARILDCADPVRLFAKLGGGLCQL